MKLTPFLEDSKSVAAALQSSFDLGLNLMALV